MTPAVTQPWIVWRGLREHPARAVVAVVAVAVGVAVYVAVDLGVQAVVDAIGPASEGGGVVLGDNREGARDFLRSIEASLAPLGAAALFIGGFVIVLTTSRTVQARRGSFAVLRAIGAGRRHVLGAVLGEAAVVGVAGTVVGVALGFALGPLVAGVVSEGFGVRVAEGSSGSLDPLAWSVAVIGGLSTPVVAAGVAARPLLRLEPGLSLRPPDEHEPSTWTAAVAGVVLLGSGVAALRVPAEHKPVAVFGAVAALMVLTPALIRPLAGVARWLGARTRLVALDLGAAHVHRDRRRLSRTVALVAGTFTLVVMVETIVATQRPAFVGAVETNFGADARFVPDIGAEPGRLPSGTDVAADLGAEAATVVRQGFGGALGGNGVDLVPIMMVDPVTYFDVAGLAWNRGTDGATAIERLRAGDGVVVGSALADDLGVARGDRLALGTPSFAGAEYEVVGTFYGFAYGELQVVVVPDAPDVLLKPFVRVDVRWPDGTDTGEALSLMVDQPPGGDRTGFLDGSYGFTLDGIRTDLVEQFDSLFGLVRVITGMLGVLAALGLVNTLTMEVLDRRHEIGVLRALGLHRRQASAMVIVEGIVLTLLAATIAVVAGTVLGWALAVDGPGEVDLPIDPRPATVSLAVFATAAVVGAGVASLVPARAASAVDAGRDRHAQ